MTFSAVISVSSPGLLPQLPLASLTLEALAGDLVPRETVSEPPFGFVRVLLKSSWRGISKCVSLQGYRDIWVLLLILNHSWSESRLSFLPFIFNFIVILYNVFSSWFGDKHLNSTVFCWKLRPFKSPLFKMWSIYILHLNIRNEWLRLLLK